MAENLLVLAGIASVFFIGSFILFTLFMEFFVVFFFVKYSKDLNELGVDRLLLMSPFFFPIRTVREILRKKGRENGRAMKCLSLLAFYKVYALISFIVSGICINIVARSNIGLE